MTLQRKENVTKKVIWVKMSKREQYTMKDKQQPLEWWNGKWNEIKY